MNEALEQQYRHLWEGLEEGWVLLKTPSLPGGYSVFNKLHSTALLIESDELNMAVCERMKDAGCEVLENIPTRDVTVTPVAPFAETLKNGKASLKSC
jgi:hypothetical protein